MTTTLLRTKKVQTTKYCPITGHLQWDSIKVFLKRDDGTEHSIDN